MIDNNTRIDTQLGAIYSKKFTEFRVWSPSADNVSLNLYKQGSGQNLISAYKMVKDENDVWTKRIDDDLSRIYYTYSIQNDETISEVVDIYANAVGVNGARGMVIDLQSTDPNGFRDIARPEFNEITDAVLYEVHVRDFSIDESSGIKLKGKFLGFTENYTKNQLGDFTGIAHLKELGITHIHLLPSFDYETIDEASNEPQFNWGYDPKNYNVPEGSYSTDANNGAVRIKEMKELVKSLHENGIRVVMDVVYNHTYKGEDSIFNLTVPNYYHRTENGKFTNGSACGNETASNHAMMRKYIVDSVLYWAQEYMIDGFRFDLMGLHDVDTMNEISQSLTKLDNSIFIYGEGWVADHTPLELSERAVKDNANKMPSIAFFSDDMRDTIKGSVFGESGKGFVNGAENLEEDLKLCITGSIKSNLVDFSKTTKTAWATSPSQVINYCEAHDNLTLWDKLYYSAKEYSVEDRKRMDKLCAAIVFLSQGVPFIQAGQEFLRSKPIDNTGNNFEENSYKSPDSVNSIKWNSKTDNKDVFEYYKGLIALRKSESLFRLKTSEEVCEHLEFLQSPKNSVVFKLKSEEKEIIVFLNANTNKIKMNFPNGKYDVVVNDCKSGSKSISEFFGGEIIIPKISALVMIK